MTCGRWPGRSRGCGVIAPDGTVTTLSANPVSMSDASAPAAGGTLVLAEPYGGWTATLNGRALQPIAAPVDGWAQGFVLPAGGGKLSISRNDLAREASLLAELIVVLAVCMLALPGKRADPAEQAEAMAALRAARDARRASGGSRLVRARAALRPIATPVGGWAQGFVLPAGGGKLSISRNDLAREASLLAELIVALAVCMLALPGKRADPAEQAEAMAALRAARDARRARGGSRRFARGAADPDVAGAGLADDGLADDGLCR